MSLSCTQDIKHMAKNSPIALYHFECIESYLFNNYPKAVNFGRVLRQFDTKMVGDAYPIA